MKKTSRKLIILILVLIVIIAFVRIFNNSKAQDIIEIKLNIIDYDGKLDAQEITVGAENDNDSGYAITLPDSIGTRMVEKYILEIKDPNIAESKEDNSILESTNQENTNSSNNKENNNENLTDEINNEENSIDKTNQNDNISNNNINNDANENETDSKETTDYTTNSKEDESTNYETTDTSNKIEDTTENASTENQIDDNTATNVTENNNKENNTAEEKNIKELLPGERIYLTDEELESKEITIKAVYGEEIIKRTSVLKAPAKARSNSAQEVWSGNIATEFAWGNGTANKPYLITNGDELAYLAQRVDNGTTFDGQYFQLAADINLGNRVWEPIGNTQNSFRGVFDGAGYMISNAVVQITTWSNSSITSYGIFGSIGNGNNRTIIRNVMFDNISVNITTSSTTSSNNQTSKGYHIGIVTGSMYKKSTIENVIITNSTIEDTNVITLRNYNSQMMIGGIAGYTSNAYNNTNDPGVNDRFKINNCYVSADIDLDIGVYNNNYNSTALGQYQTGGIIGGIKGQLNVPTDCLYTGAINTNGLIGPIFGGLSASTTPSNRTRINTVWTGNDYTSMTMESYYTDFTIDNTQFTSSVMNRNDTVDRLSTDSYDNAYLQGINRGVYTNNMTAMLNMFNGNITSSNKYLTWIYEDNTFTFKESLTTEISDTNKPTYTVVITDPYNVGTYTYIWEINGETQTDLTGNSYTWEWNLQYDENLTVVTSDGSFFAISKYTIPKIEINIVFNVNNNTDTVVATLTGSGLQYTRLEAYTYQWYKLDIVGDMEELEGKTSLTLNNLEEGMEYRLVATNNEIPQLTVEDSFVYGNRVVVYVDYNNGSNYNDGWTDTTPVEDMETAYRKLTAGANRNLNVIVVMGTYPHDSDFLTSENSTIYNKQVTITGKYAGIDYNGVLSFLGSPGDNTYPPKFLNADTTFMQLKFDGGVNGRVNTSYSYMYFFLQGYSLTIGENVIMQNYTTANTYQGLITNDAPGFHIFGGWLMYNKATLPQNNGHLIIKSGQYGRVVLGGSSGLSDPTSMYCTTSHNFVGSNLTTDKYVMTCDIDIKNSTTNYSTYSYDVNLLVGGAASGNQYSDITLNIKKGKVGRVLGGSIGDSSTPYPASRRSYSWWTGEYTYTWETNWNNPMNTYFGSSTINVTGGTVAELYGASLGRNMDAINENDDNTDNPCDAFYYGKIEINISGGEITRTIYGVGAGAITGYSANSTDQYKNLGRDIETSVTINISGGTINADVYGGGYGYTEYLTPATIAADSGTLYGNSTINISGSPTITGSIYGAGRGYDLSSRPKLAQVYGTTTLNIEGTPSITGQIYGAGMGLSGYDEMAKLTGDSIINVKTNLSIPVYGGGEIAQTVGNTTINIETGTHTGDIFGGGNEGKVEGTATINIKGGTNSKVFGGGNQAEVTSSVVNINNGTNTEVYGGGNKAKVTDTEVNVNNGTNTLVYGGGNEGEVESSAVNINNGTNTEVYGGGNKAKVTDTEVNVNNGTNALVYGGGNEGEVTNSTVNINSGQTTTLYGGGNKAKVDETEVYMNNGTVTTLYGGGNQAETPKTNVYLEGGTVGTTFGGGNQAGATETNVTCNGTSVTTAVFGGSNNNGTVPTSNVTVNSGNIQSVYGGNNAGGTTTTSNVIVNNGNMTNVYGGGDQAVTGTTNVDIKSGNIDNVFGGGNKAATTTSNVTTRGGIIENVYGGGNQAGVTTTFVNAKGGEIEKVFGGSNTSGNVTTSNVTTGNSENDEASGGIKMEITQTVEDAGWRKNTYPDYQTYAKFTVKVINNTENTLEHWNGSVYVKDSMLFANYTSTEIIENNDTYTFSEANRYYGTNQVLAGQTYSFDIELLTKQSIDDFKASYTLSGTDTLGNTLSYEKLELKANQVYGGNNQGGKTSTANVTINEGEITDVFGGGNEAETTVTNVNINGEVLHCVYGGGNKAGVETNTTVNLNGATVGNNVYGGGNEGRVVGNTYVRVKDSTLNESVYAGGNGASAVVQGNTNITLEGTENNITKNVFGGGNKAETGTVANNNSVSTVNIVGGTIGGNVYGGANTSVVYGYTRTNIGYDAVGDNTLTKGNIEITGTVFGGGEANESGDENYDFSFISVTKGIDILIDGNTHNTFYIRGSIFGSGNASSTSGYSYITIKNYGTFDNPQKNISLQRTNCATIINSAIALSGATDRTNEYSTTFFSISNVDRVKLANGSTLFLNNGANLLKNFDSLLIENNTETKAAVTINEETGTVTKNVDNRIYMLEGKNLNIATNQQATTYGDVYGMTFFGIYTNKTNPSTSTAFYHNSYNQGDTVDNEGTFAFNSYVKGRHIDEHFHDLTEDGFYTNYKEDGLIKVDYIDASPPDDIYYMWLVGEVLDVTTFEVELTASKYATLGTYELSLDGFADSNTRMAITGFSAGLEEGISLVNPSEINAIEQDETRANSVYGLTMKTGNIGWMTRGTSTFLSERGGTYTGTHTFKKDNSTYTPTFNLCFYHSQNISQAQQLGDVRVRLQVFTPIDDLNDKVSWIDINITLASALYQNGFFEAAITPGAEFGLFTTTDTTITDKGLFSAYYSLYMDEFSDSKYFDDYTQYHRVLVSMDSEDFPYALPADTKIVMLDMVTNKYYYYIVTVQDETMNKYVYDLADFIAMGSVNGQFDESDIFNTHYIQNQDIIYENYIFHINFKDATLENDIEENSLLIELRDNEEQTLIGVLGIERETMVYNVYANKDATIDLTAELSKNTVYLGNNVGLNVTTEFNQTKINSKTIYDTQYFEKKLGIKIGIYNNEGSLLSNMSLLGIYYELDGIRYYPRFDGTTRICISDAVTDVLAKLTIHTKNNKTLGTGDYTIKIESFGSADGIYYGLEPSDTVEIPLRIISFSYGLKVASADTAKIVDREKGVTESGSNSLNTSLQYSSNLSNPNTTVSLYRRDYTDVYSMQYTLVDIKDYFSNDLILTSHEKEYRVSNNPMANSTYFMLLKENLPSTGTFKIVYKLYDDTTYIGEDYEYIIIK